MVVNVLCTVEAEKALEGKNGNMMVRVFISHSRKNDDFGAQLVQDLRHILSEEHTVWYDVRGGLKPGDSWFQCIEQELVNCDIFLIIVSPEAMSSDWVRREFDIALIEKKVIIPVLYQRCNLWPYLKTIHYVSFLSATTYEAGLGELLTALRLSTPSP